MALGLLSGAMSGLGSAFGGGPRVTTVSPTVDASISAPFAAGRGATATARQPGGGAGDVAQGNVGVVGLMVGSLLLAAVVIRGR